MHYYRPLCNCLHTDVKMQLAGDSRSDAAAAADVVATSGEEARRRAGGTATAGLGRSGSQDPSSG